MTKFGIRQIGNSTPKWAKWFFRIYFFLSKAFVGWAAATSVFDKATLYEIVLFITLFLDSVFYSVSKMFGIQESELKESTNEDVK